MNRNLLRSQVASLVRQYGHDAVSEVLAQHAAAAQAPVDLSCHLCRRHPCECEALERRVREYNQRGDD